MTRSLAAASAVMCLLSTLAGCGFGGGGWFQPPANTPPDISGVTATLGVFGDGSTPQAYVSPAGTDVPFYASFEGSTATAYSWDFGTAGTPAASAEALPRIALPVAGSYNCSVTVTNPYGTDSFPFTLTVDLPPLPVLDAAQLIVPGGTEATELLSGSVYDALGLASAGASWDAAHGRPESVWDWDFGGGATPNMQHSIEEYGYGTITMGDPGTYHGTVTMTNGAGSDSYDFDYTVEAP